jgi:hypothetical protein
MRLQVPLLNPAMWIRIGFNADPDLAFYLNLDPNLGSQTNADPDPDPNPDLDLDPGQTLELQNSNF